MHAPGPRSIAEHGVMPALTLPCTARQVVSLVDPEQLCGPRRPLPHKQGKGCALLRPCSTSMVRIRLQACCCAIESGRARLADSSASSQHHGLDGRWELAVLCAALVWPQSRVQQDLGANDDQHKR